MPHKTNRPCPGRGPYLNKCSNVLKNGVRYCSVCIEYFNKELKNYNKQYDIRRNKSIERRFIHSTQWRKARLRKLALDPYRLCEQCLQEGKEIQAVLVHHIDGNELNNNENNYKSLCNNCHEIIHKKERWGKRKMGISNNEP